MLQRLNDKHGSNIKGMMIQSDQGVQYQNSRYSEGVKNLGMTQSMGRKGTCLDNSPTGNFFGRMKAEMWHGQEERYKNSNELIKYNVCGFIRFISNKRESKQLNRI